MNDFTFPTVETAPPDARPLLEGPQKSLASCRISLLDCPIRRQPWPAILTCRSILPRWV